MIQIDMDIPKSCRECPFLDYTYQVCCLVPVVPAWQKDILKNCTDRRSEHCPLINVVQEKAKEAANMKKVR